MNITLNNRTALVGAATDGIGKAIALELANCGATVILVARNLEKLQNVRDQLSTSAGQNHEILVVDYNDYEKTVETYRLFFESHTIDILVNNTNGPKPGDVFSSTLQDFEEAFHLLFQNTVALTQFSLVSMQNKKFGRIINVASSTVKEPADHLILSNTMRTAMVSWMKSLSKALAKDNITVNTVLTGLFDTERLKSLLENTAKKEKTSVEEAKNALLETLPMKRVGKPEEYGYLVAFLASDFAGYLTGTTIPLDGGKSMYL